MSGPPVSLRLRAAVGALFPVLLWLSLFQFPLTPRAGLDSSWGLALGYAFKRGWLVGQDYVFTHGPLGFFARAKGRYDPELFASQLCYKALLTSLLVAVFVAGIRRLPHVAHRVAAGLVLTVVVSQFPGEPLHFLGLAAAALLLISSAAGESPATFCLPSPSA